MLAVLAAEKTRPVLWHLSTGLEVLWYALAVFSVLVFAYGVARPVAKYKRGRAIFLPPRSQLWPRFKRATTTLFKHSTIARRDPLAGWAHRGAFYGFLVLFIGTVILAIDTDIVHRIFGYSYFKGNFYLVYSVILDVLGLALVGGLTVMMVRRGILRPRKLDYARPDREPGEEQYDRHVYRVGDWVFLGVLLTIALTGYLLEGVRVAETNPGYNAWSPVGWVFAQLYDALGISQSGLADIRHGIWWFHGLLAISFVAAIPYTKAFHMLSSYASLVLKDPLAGKRLRPIPEELASEPAGYATLADFSITHLLQLDACTKCGRCHEVCPANTTGRPLSPRDVVLELREQANASMDEVGIGGVLGTLMHGSNGNETMRRQVIGEHAVHVDTVWSCMQCNACVEICPVGIEQAPIINQLRRHLIEEGELDTNLQSTLQVIHKSGNSFGENRRRRGRWTQELDFEVKDARAESVDLLWFVGDYASFDPRSQRVTRALAEILQGAGVDFGIMFDGERNAGNDVRRVGEEGLFEALAEHNVAALQECDFNRILTSDPHSLNTLRNEYPGYGGEWEVVHHTALLLELIEEGRLDVDGRLSYRVTYHDPCYLGRHNGGYDAPREVLRRLGCELIEMPRNRDNSFCCGAGGGRIWIPDTPGAERPSENRIREAVSVGPLDLFVVTCPKDVTMFEDAIKTSGHADDLRLAELTELVQEALVAAPVAGGAV
jgi:Fe-S oxidoreductase/nitrate reductase gamma subunit